LFKKECYYCGEKNYACINDYIDDKCKSKFCGIDRMDNNIGYTIDNCVPCCIICNMMKGNKSIIGKKVIQYDLKGHFIKIWDTIKYAALELKIPDPDFILSFTIRAFRGKITQEPTATTGIYRVLATVKIENADKNFNKVYIDERIFDTIFVRIPAGSSAQIEAWQQYQKSLAQLITGMAKAFNKVDSKWLEDSVANGQNAKDAFTSTSQLFKSLR
jgi:hypothetical protein